MVNKVWDTLELTEGTPGIVKVEDVIGDEIAEMFMELQWGVSGVPDVQLPDYVPGSRVIRGLDDAEE